MARKDDKGGYSVDNVECILHSKNVSEMSKNNTIAFGINQGRAKLNEEAVRDIFQTTDSYRNLCHKYQIKVGTILDIRRRVTWKRITDKLTRKSLRGRKGLRQIA